MRKVIGEDETRELELMIDGASLPEVLQVLANICSDKADHIQASYNDSGLADCWRRDAKILMTASKKIGG